MATYVQKKHPKMIKNQSTLTLLLIKLVTFKENMLLIHQHLMRLSTNTFLLLIDKRKTNKLLKILHGRNSRTSNRIRWAEYKNYKQNRMSILSRLDWYRIISMMCRPSSISFKRWLMGEFHGTKFKEWSMTVKRRAILYPI